MAQPDLQEIHDCLVKIARDAGKMIISAPSDLVTETDQAVEDMVSKVLTSKYPTYKFLGEETYHPGMKLTEAPTFVCDPIDGTTNFVHAHPYVSISLAFVHDLTPMVGVVYNPFTDQLYHAIHGKGAFLTSTPSHIGESQDRKLPLRTYPEPLTSLDRSLISVEWGNEREGNNWEVKLDTISALASSKKTGGSMVHSLRSLGSAALNLCGVATGALDAYWEGGCWAWDVAAGWVVLKEAGGMMVGANKGEWNPTVDGRKYLAIRAANVEEQKQFVETFWGVVKGTLKYEV